jgi:hypothetical protein
MNKVTRSERLLERLVNQGKLTENGKAAFIAAVDPYHDMQIDHLRGWPDYETQPSVIRTVKSSLTVASAGEGSSIVIQTWPVLDPVTYNLATRSNNVVSAITPGASTDAFTAPVVVERFLGGDFQIASRVDTADISPENSFFDSNTRLIGMGVEVHDVSAEIYKQGTLTVTQFPQSQKMDNTINIAAITVSGVGHGTTTLATRQVNRHTTSLEAAMLFEGTRQWDCAQGCYAVVPFASSENPPVAPEYCQPLYFPYPTTDQTGAANTLAFRLPANTANASTFPMQYNCHRWAPVHSKCIFLTGLNEKSTFTINTIMYLETFPDLSVAGTPLVTLARPSCPYDGLALKMISCAMQDLPIAVPVADNNMGDWILDAIDILLPIAGSFLGGAIGGPAGAAMGGTAGKAITGAIASQRKPSQQPAPPSAYRAPPLTPQKPPAQPQNPSAKKRRRKRKTPP